MNKLIPLVLSVLSSVSQAAFLDFGHYSTDTASGLDWLDLTQTTGMSVNQVNIETMAGGTLNGWRYATGDEFDQLLINLGYAPSSCANGTQFCSFSTSYRELNAPLIVQIGDTSGLNAPLDPIELFQGWSRGLLADEAGSADARWMAVIDWDGLNTHHLSQGVSAADVNTGSYLVRATSPVPIPASIWLFLTGISGLLLRGHINRS